MLGVGRVHSQGRNTDTQGRDRLPALTSIITAIDSIAGRAGIQNRTIGLRSRQSSDPAG
jgi:hypothetical protein